MHRVSTQTGTGTGTRRSSRPKGSNLEDKDACDLTRLSDILLSLQADLITKADCDKLAAEIAKREPKLHILGGHRNYLLRTGRRT